jgi:hypothetical protein
MDCSDWTNEIKIHYEKANNELGFFKSNDLKMREMKVTEFPAPN